MPLLSQVGALQGTAADELISVSLGAADALRACELAALLSISANNASLLLSAQIHGLRKFWLGH